MWTLIFRFSQLTFKKQIEPLTPKKSPRFLVIGRLQNRGGDGFWGERVVVIFFFFCVKYVIHVYAVIGTDQISHVQSMVASIIIKERPQKSWKRSHPVW